MKERRAELQGVDLDRILQPETPLERLIIQDKGFRRGLLWGVPRYGHPEGEVYKHIRDVFDNIDRLQVAQLVRERLRLVALVHDSFKHKEDKRKPRDWSKHHGVLARQFLAQYTDDEVVLTITEKDGSPRRQVEASIDEQAVLKVSLTLAERVAG